MNAIEAEFEECQITPWKGRYARVMGEATVFHLRRTNRGRWPMLVWETDGGRVQCPAIDCPAARRLVGAIAGAKKYAGGEGGGSFVIDEYGRIIVPASDGGGQRFLVGRLNGRLVFENPLSPEEPIDLGDDGGLKLGDIWKGPYVGIPYHLHRTSQIYFYQQDEEGGRSIYPPQQDFELIRAIRNLRPFGAVRIVVTPGGLVLTKVSSGMWQSEDQWKPVFVRAINFNFWFEEE